MREEKKIYLLIYSVVLVFITAILVGLTVEGRTEIRAAENKGFVIGSGVLEQSWHCAPPTKHTTLSEAKKQVEINQGKIVE